MGPEIQSVKPESFDLHRFLSWPQATWDHCVRPVVNYGMPLFPDWLHDAALEDGELLKRRKTRLQMGLTDPRAPGLKEAKPAGSMLAFRLTARRRCRTGQLEPRARAFPQERLRRDGQGEGDLDDPDRGISERTDMKIPR